MNSWEQDFFAANLANNTEAADYVIVQDINGDSVACYGSGSWARDYVLAGLVGSACATFAFGLNVGKYIIADLNQAPADSNRYQGSTQILKYTGLYNEANDPMNVFYKYTPSATGFTGSVACAGTLTHLINDLCQGKNDDTRGGEIKTKNEKFSVDPTTLNCNC